VNLDNQDIGELFRDAFDGFEADVDGNMWNNIQNQMQAGGASGAAAGAGASSGISSAMITGIAITSAIVGAGIFYFASGESQTQIVDNNTPAPSEVVIAAPIENKIPANAIIVERLESPAEAEVVLTAEEQLLEEIVESQQNDAEVDALIESMNPNYDRDKAAKFNESRLWTSTNNDFTNGNGTGVATPQESTVNTNNASATNPEKAQSPPTTEPNAEVVNQQIDDAPIAYIESSVVGGFAPLQVTFNSGYEAHKYSWDFDNGETAEGAQSDFTFDEPGEYRVLLTTYSASGKTQTDEMLIEVNGRSDIPKENLPNIITPNGDGQNDRLAFKVVDIQALYVVVLDQSGKILFESDNTYDLWDGTNADGSPAAEGTYYYIIKAVGIDGTVIERKESVDLIR
jgi:gliding motility-associated-like protein